MYRRQFLASVPALASSTAIVGCLGTSEEEERTTPPVSLAVEVLQSFADDHPARLRLTFANEADEQLLLSPGTMQGVAGPLTAISGSRRDDGRELLLFYRGVAVEQYALCIDEGRSPIPDEPIDGCWQPPCADGLEIITAHGPLELVPGETLTGEYTVLDGFDDGCLAPGTYDFEDSTAVGPAVQTGDTVEFEGTPGTLERRLSLTIDERDVSGSASANVIPDDEAESPDSGPTPEPTA